VREIRLEMKAPPRVYALEQNAPARPLATKDCFENGGGPFRKFLWAAAREGGKREDYAGFYRLYELLDKAPSLEEVLAELAKEFPSREQAPALQSLLFGKPYERLFRQEISESTILSALGSCENYEAIDAVGLHLKDRATGLAEDFAAARSLIGGLFDAPLNPIGLEILSGFLSDLNSDVAREITQAEPRFLSILVSAKPSLATSPSIWNAAMDRRSLFESVVHNRNLDSDTIEGIVQALLESGTDDLIRWAFSEWGDKAVSGTLNWMVRHEGNLSPQCFDALTFQTAAVMDWLEKEPEKPLFAFYVAACIVAPYANQINRRDTSMWNRALLEALERKDDPKALRFITFMLALGLSNAPPSPLDLIGNCFEIVHQAEAKERLPIEAWRYLEPLVPYALVYWDKCDRMRRGLAASFIKYNWPPEELRQRISNRRLLDSIFDSSKHVDGGKAYFKGYK
jgi:hypothetical protein